eukprot:TRINITY_DN55150_c0_g1_i1.p1 TRINITY_DN55150_c0_g1~~TRINITY_DN55150_c0_g1_i1.p1  ORF type:complete len:174 (+),score=23.42 TRINITY_DN55150_c0_g1_i1:44-565(+)
MPRAFIIHHSLLSGFAGGINKVPTAGLDSLVVGDQLLMDNVLTHTRQGRTKNKNLFAAAICLLKAKTLKDYRVPHDVLPIVLEFMTTELNHWAWATHATVPKIDTLPKLIGCPAVHVVNVIDCHDDYHKLVVWGTTKDLKSVKKRVVGPLHFHTDDGRCQKYKNNVANAKKKK